MSEEDWLLCWLLVWIQALSLAVLKSSFLMRREVPAVLGAEGQGRVLVGKVLPTS